MEADAALLLKFAGGSLVSDASIENRQFCRVLLDRGYYTSVSCRGDIFFEENLVNREEAPLIDQSPNSASIPDFHISSVIDS